MSNQIVVNLVVYSKFSTWAYALNIKLVVQPKSLELNQNLETKENYESKDLGRKKNQRRLPHKQN